MAFEVVRRSFPVIEDAKGELKAAKTTDIKCKVEGRTTIIWLIEEGKTVEKDELLVRLASDKIEERIRQEEAKEASADPFSLLEFPIPGFPAKDGESGRPGTLHGSLCRNPGESEAAPGGCARCVQGATEASGVFP